MYQNYKKTNKKYRLQNFIALRHNRGRNTNE